jgi:hypothetical protein
MLENLKSNQKRSILIFFLYMILSYAFTFIEMFTKFATVRLAINGESFWEGTKQIGSLLKRNFLDV